MNYDVGDLIWVEDKEWQVEYSDDDYLELKAFKNPIDEVDDYEVEEMLPEDLTKFFFDHGEEVDLGDLDPQWVGFVIHRGDDSFILVDSVKLSSPL